MFSVLLGHIKYKIKQDYKRVKKEKNKKKRPKQTKRIQKDELKARRQQEVTGTHVMHVEHLTVSMKKKFNFTKNQSCKLKQGATQCLLNCQV